MLHSNKQGSNTVPVTHRPDFKQALSTLQQFKQKAEGNKRPLTFTEINKGHRVFLLLHGGSGKVHGGLLVLMKVTMEMNQVLTERSDLLNNIWNNSFNHFVTGGPFTADVGLL